MGMKYLGIRLGLLLLCSDFGLLLLVTLRHDRTGIEALAIGGSQALLVWFAESSFALLVGFVLAFEVVVGHCF